MSETDKNAILIRALEASGSEREAQLARAILGDPAAGAPETPAAAAPDPAAAPPAAGAPAPAGLPTQVAQLGGELAAGTTPGTPPGGLPEGIMSAEELDAYERPKGLSYREQVELNKRVVDSWDFHNKGQR
jgi:hypothetical protein